ncbi:general transcription factor 3C polypeptide 3 isoform X1 [Patella vulgata]|uniref:general transcription factor 3C polypeptide 3 isoform X1 n=1 Tax=Patella vulgata TaxID=6465 RepID=UPI00217FA186|nr:general transcription factor 3C polypeptide 3 isoform X1 [Patella vulgata]
MAGSEDSENLFRNLEGAISHQQLKEWKKMQKSCGNLIVNSDEEEDEEESMVEMCLESLNVPSSSVVSSDTPGSSHDLSAVGSDITLQYLTGQITFEEFSAQMEMKQQEKQDSVAFDSTEVGAEEEVSSEDLKKTQQKENQENAFIPPNVSKVQAKKSPVKFKKPRRKKTDIPKSLHGLMGEANLQFARGEHDEAIKMCMEVIRLAPNAYLPFQTLGMLYEELGNSAKALQFYLIAAHLCPDDSEEWVRLAEMSLEQNDIKQAIACYAKAIRFAPGNMEYVWQKCSLHEQLGETKKVLEGYQHILRLLPKTEGEKYLHLARDMTKTYHEMGEEKIAIDIMTKAFENHPSLLTAEDTNLLLELLITHQQFFESVQLMVRHCDVEITLSDQTCWNKDNDIEKEKLEENPPTSCMIPDLLAVDLQAKLIVSLIRLKCLDVVKSIKCSLFEETVEEVGDLFLDVAEAYMEVSSHQDAIPILQDLVKSVNFNKAAVFLRYAECLNSIGDLQAAVEAYTKVVELAPAHFGARVSLSALQQQLGKHEEAVQILSREEQEERELSQEDQVLLLHKSHLLYSQNRFEEFYICSKKLLFQHFREVYSPAFMKLVFSYRAHKHRADALRAYINFHQGQSSLESFLNSTSSKNTADKTAEVTSDDMWGIYLKLCNALLESNRLEELLEITTLGLTCPQFMKDEEKIRETEFMCLIACILNKNGQFAYGFVKDICLKHKDNNQAWNLFQQVISFANDARHNKFAFRLLMKNPESIPLGLTNGHNCLLSGSYKNALGEYVNVLRQIPNDPMVNLCVGLCYIHIACQKFSAKKHSLFVQGISMLNKYIELRGECQETYYNMGRALHQLDLKYAAVFYYKKALTFPPVIDHPDAIYDLRRETAFNLSLIYETSGSVEYARVLLQQYCVI